MNCLSSLFVYEVCILYCSQSFVLGISVDHVVKELPWKNPNSKVLVCENWWASCTNIAQSPTNNYRPVPYKLISTISISQGRRNNHWSYLILDFKSPNWHGILFWIYFFTRKYWCSLIFMIVGRIRPVPLLPVIFDQSNLPPQTCC